MGQVVVDAVGAAVLCGPVRLWALGGVYLGSRVHYVVEGRTFSKSLQACTSPACTASCACVQNQGREVEQLVHRCLCALSVVPFGGGQDGVDKSYYAGGPLVSGSKGDCLACTGGGCWEWGCDMGCAGVAILGGCLRWACPPSTGVRGAGWAEPWNLACGGGMTLPKWRQRARGVAGYWGHKGCCGHRGCEFREQGGGWSGPGCSGSGSGCRADAGRGGGWIGLARQAALAVMVVAAEGAKHAAGGAVGGSN
jgi:hypothetical protein